MGKECKEGEFTLVYNSGDCGYVTALTREQHNMLQLLLASLGNIQVIKKIKVKYERDLI